MHGLMQSGPSMGMPQMGMPGIDPVSNPCPTFPYPSPNLLLISQILLLPSPTLPLPSPNFPLPTPTLPYLHLPFHYSVISYPHHYYNAREKEREREKEKDFGSIDILHGVCACVCVLRVCTRDMPAFVFFVTSYIHRHS